MTKAFDTALFVPPTNPDTGQAVGIGVVGPPFDSEWFYYAIANGPDVTIDASIPAATDAEQTLVSGPSPEFEWIAKLPYYLGALSSPPPTNAARGATTPVQNGAMYFSTVDGTPYVWDGAVWHPFPLAAYPRLIVSASLPAATLDGQMLIAGPRGNQGGRTVFPWEASIGPFLGAHPVPPTTTSANTPIPIGSFYYNTANGQVYVWNGSTWKSMTVPTKAATASLFYQSTAGQTVFPTTVNDGFGHNHTLDPTGVEGVEVHLNGLRLTPSGGAIAGGYSVNASTSQIVLTTGAALNAVVAIDILENPANFSPAQVQIQKLRPLAFDGVTTTFPLLNSTGAGVIAGDSVDLQVFLDGVEQQPGVDFILDVTGGEIIFNEAPFSDVISWIIYFG